MVMGTISSIDGGVKILLDGEDVPTLKSYSYLSSYTPVVGDRVLIEEFAGSYVILGKVVK